MVDLKGAYHGTPVDNPPNAELYRRVAEAFPDAWIEDPGLTPETDAVLEPHRDRITWDAPIHSWADVEALPFPPRCLNSKPSRFGSLARLFEFYDRCAEHGIALYGGGQFELGAGPRPDPAPRGALPPGRLERRRARRLQRTRAARGPAGQPARSAACGDRLPSRRVAIREARGPDGLPRHAAG